MSAPISRVCDLGDSEAVAGLPGQAESQMGGLDILVNNAGLTRDNLVLRMKDDEWDTVLNVNLTAGFKLARGALRGMMKKRWGRIISITSIVGTTGNPGQANYAASKAGRDGHDQGTGPGGRDRGALQSIAWRRASSRRR